LISPKGTALHIRDVPQRSGGVLFAVDLMLNEESIAFSPGGRYGHDVLLYGMVGTLLQPVAASKSYMPSLQTASAKILKRSGNIL
jgi:hypothetical protein